MKNMRDLLLRVQIDYPFYQLVLTDLNRALEGYQLTDQEKESLIKRDRSLYRYLVPVNLTIEGSLLDNLKLDPSLEEFPPPAQPDMVMTPPSHHPPDVHPPPEEHPPPPLDPWLGPPTTPPPGELLVGPEKGVDNVEIPLIIEEIKSSHGQVRVEKIERLMEYLS